MVKNLPAKQGIQVQSLGREDPLEKEMANHSSILVWEISRTGEPGRLQSMRLQRTRHNFVTKQKQQRAKGRRQDGGVGSAMVGGQGRPP